MLMSSNLKKQNSIHLFGIGLFFCLYSAGCSFSATPAYAPTNPPVVKKKPFQSSSLVGNFKLMGSPTLFLWPTDRWDEQQNLFLPLSFEEKVLSRMKITRLSEEVEFYSAQIEPLELQLKTKYEGTQKTLENEFKTALCYSFCSPEDFLCDPSDDTILIVDEWLESEDPAEQEIIRSCQNNQAQRLEIKKLWDFEKKEKILPLQQKAGAAALALLETIGDRNYIPHLTDFYFSVDPQKNQSLTINLVFGGRMFSSQPGVDELSIEILESDLLNGFVVFKIPFLDPQENGQIKGELIFDLEMVFNNETLRVDGDFQKIINGKEPQVGRFSSKGSISSL